MKFHYFINCFYRKYALFIIDWNAKEESFFYVANCICCDYSLSFCNPLYFLPIQDEITPDIERSMQHLSLDVPEEIVAYLPTITNKTNERQNSSSKYDLSHSQTLDTHNVFA